MTKAPHLAWFALLAACGSTDSGADGPSGADGSSSVDSPSSADAPRPIDGAPTVDAPPGTCSHAAPFSSTVEVLGINGALDEFAPRLTHDELRIVFTRLSTPGPVGDLFFATRSARDGAFTGVTQIPGSVNTSGDEYTGWLSEDGRDVYFDRLDASGYNIFHGTRAGTGDNFGTPSEVSNVSQGTTSSDYEPFVVPGVGMYFGSLRSGNSSDIWFAPENGSGFGTPTILHANVSAVGVHEELPTPSMDGLAIYFFRYPAPPLDVWVSTRSSTSADWSVATNVLGAVNTVDYEEHPGWLSDDNCRLYYATRELGNLNIRMAVRAP